MEKRTWSVNSDWKKVIFSDESQMVIGTDCCVYIWRKSDEAWLPECITPGIQEIKSHDLGLHHF